MTDCMNTLRIITILLLSIVLISCEADVGPKPVVSGIRGVLLTDLQSEYDAGDILITIVANGVAFSDKVGTIEVIGSFIDSLGKETYVEAFLINGESIEEIPGYPGVYRRVYGFNGNEKEDGEAMFGDTLTIEVEGVVNLPGFTFKFYMPELINFIVYDHGRKIDPDLDLTVTWTPDLRNTEDVEIAIMRPDSISGSNLLFLDSWYGKDNGSYTIPKSELQQFKNADWVRIGIQRAPERVEVLNATSNYKAVVAVVNYDVSREITVGKVE
jgi:hypothetical protein